MVIYAVFSMALNHLLYEDLAVSSTADKMEATESKCALPMFIADHTAKFLYNGLVLPKWGIYSTKAH